MAKFWDDHKKVLIPLILMLLALIYLSFTNKTGFGWPTGLIDPGSSTSKTKQYSSFPTYNLVKNVDYKAKINVSGYGAFTLDLYETDTPNAVNNFVFLASENFYNNLSIASIQKDKLFQSGDPEGDYTGPGYKFNDEIKSNIHIKPYSIAYANSGPNTNGSQYFVVCKNVPESKLTEWDGKFTVFGEVVDGQSVVDKICNIDTSLDGSKKNIVILSVTTFYVSSK